MNLRELPKSHFHNGMCIVNHEKHIIFINIPKNASTSIRLKLFSLGFKWGNIKNIDPQNYFIFTVVRDPIDRFLSQYLEMLTRANGDCKIYGANKKPFFKINDPKRQFKFFINNELGRGNLFEIHLQRQVWFLTSKEGQFKVDKFIKLQDLQQNLRELSKQFNLPLIVTHRNKKSPSRKAQLKEWLYADPKLLGIIHDVYKDDFALFENLKV